MDKKKSGVRPTLRNKMTAAYQKMQADSAKSRTPCKKCGEKGQDCECKKA